MENITVIGLKEMNQKLGRIERHLEDISKSLALLTKVTDRQFPRDRINPKEIYTPDVIPFSDEEDE